MIRFGRTSMWPTRIHPELLRLPSDTERRNVVSWAGSRISFDWPRLCILIVVTVIGMYSLTALAEAAHLPFWAVNLMKSSLPHPDLRHHGTPV